MKSFASVPSLLLAAMLVAVTPAAAAESHGHEAHGAGEAKLSLNKGAKWSTDAALRDGMWAIRGDLNAALPEIHRNAMPDERYGALADGIQGHIDRMVATCKLPPEVDAQLHIVLAQIIEGTDAMKKGPSRRSGALALLRALEDYGRHFNHPGWKSAGH